MFEQFIGPLAERPFRQQRNRIFAEPRAAFGESIIGPQGIEMLQVHEVRPVKGERVETTRMLLLNNTR